jgi:hypothetical protein
VDQLWFELDVVRQRLLRPAVEVMVAELGKEGRLTAEHAPIVSLFLKLADALDASGGRGASIAMLSAQFQEVWDRLISLTVDDEDDVDDEHYDVVLLPAAMPDAS